MFRFVRLCFGMLGGLFRGRRSLLLENLALRRKRWCFTVLKRGIHSLSGRFEDFWERRSDQRKTVA